MEIRIKNLRTGDYLRSVRRLLSFGGLIVACPLAGVWISGKPLTAYLQFPPVPDQVSAQPFSWGVFWLIVVLAFGVLTPFLRRIFGATTPPLPGSRAKHRFPLWGWLGVALMLSSWLVAWNRFWWAEGIQEYTFTPLWLSFILVVNALSYLRSGHCTMLDHSFRFLLLFPVSAYFWWSFEFLNRFVQNWYYVGISDFGPLRYFLYVTLPFSTVLPAILGTAELLATFPTLGAALQRFRPVPVGGNRMLAAVCLVLASVGLIVLGIWPNRLFPLLWLVPVSLVIGLQSLTEKPSLLVQIGRGDWRRAWILAMSGLICGWFWEMWNQFSFAHWQYSISYLQKFKVFEMPLLGYLGYLPFGVLCGLFAEFILPSPIEKTVGKG